jgi:hypothetical protein
VHDVEMLKSSAATMTGAKCGRESFESFPQPSSSATNGVINRSLSSLASLGTGEASADMI